MQPQAPAAQAKPKRKMNLKLNMTDISNNAKEGVNAMMAPQGTTSQVEGTQAFTTRVDIGKLSVQQKASILLDTRQLRQDLSRQLTSHVATRFYRAPELILMEKDYN